MGIMSPLSGYISDKVGAAKITLVGLVIMTLGLGLLATMTATEPVIKLIVFLCIVGLGAGIFSAPNTSLIMSTAPRGKAWNRGQCQRFYPQLWQCNGFLSLPPCFTL